MRRLFKRNCVAALRPCNGSAASWINRPRERNELNMKKMFSLILALAMLCGCAGIASAEEETVKPVILVVSFGTSYNDSRDVTIGAIESDIAAAYPDYEVRRAFTAQTIIDILADREGLEIDNVTEAMERLVADGVKNVVVQPTHIMHGYEYDDMVEEIMAYADSFYSLAIGEPLLSSFEDYEAVTAALLADNENAGSADTALVFMGHGTEHFANATYSELEAVMQAEGYTNAFVGTVEGFPTLEVVQGKLAVYGAKNVVLMPLMVVAGDHANNDMAGDEEDSWKTILTNAGYEVECVLEGMGQNAAIRAIYVEHVGAAIAGGNA